ncbi:hypothetical protein K503DRAFT_692542 [Rhizopogon vinicolor AM-OR11-026]|uniref:60S ribosomal protein L31 n=1 Tax=Rhizopogon vinicolor AM-OR11-026 TaxID=1314800 RepID=A0A1B7MZ71_9AGAM|nr:hypothetical protein K503DRAFT_692542 [Rhizopogon vinicolor AM-OR11-026]
MRKKPVTKLFVIVCGIYRTTVKFQPRTLFITAASQPQPTAHGNRPRHPQDMTGGKRSALQDVVTREYTIHLHKLVHGRSFKKRAPWAVKSVVEFARKSMGTTDVRLDPKLNQALWARGVKTVPHRIRVKLEREYSIDHDDHNIKGLLCGCVTGKRNDEEGAKEKLFTYASHVPVTSFKGLQNTVADAE